MRMRFHKTSYLLSILLFSSAGFCQTYDSEEDSLLHLIATSSDLTDIAGAHSRISWLLMTRDTESASLHLDTAMIMFEELEDDKGIALTSYRKAVVKRLTGNYTEGISLMNRFLEYAQAKKDTFNIANSQYQIGVLYSLQGNYESSLQCYFEAINLFEAVNDSAGMNNTLNSIGIVYKNLERYQEAIAHYERSEELSLAMNDEQNLAVVYNSLGNIYSILEDYKLAHGYYSKSLEINRRQQSAWGTGLALLNIGTLYIEEKNYDEALKYLLEAYEVNKSNNQKTDLAATLVKLASIKRKFNEFDESQKFLEEALALDPESKKIEMELHFEFYQLYRELNNFKAALTHFESYSAAKDSIFKEENLRSLNALQVHYETEKKDKELAKKELLIKDRDNQLLRKESQNRMAMAGGIFLLFGSIGMIFFYNQRQRLKDREIKNLTQQKEIATLEGLIEGEEKERGRIAQDLHDGINGDLSVIKYKLTSLDKGQWEGRDKESFENAIEMLDNAVEQVRFISHNLAPASLQNFSLEEAISQLCNRVNSSYDINIEFQFFGSRLMLNKKVETAIYRMTQEMINNIIKHSKADYALIQLNNHTDTVSLTIEDNGIGFDADQKNNGLGLQTIKSRVNLLNAEMTIHSSHEGTTFVIDIDLEKIPKL